MSQDCVGAAESALPDLEVGVHGTCLCIPVQVRILGYVRSTPRTDKTSSPRSPSCFSCFDRLFSLCLGQYIPCFKRSKLSGPRVGNMKKTLLLCFIHGFKVFYLSSLFHLPSPPPHGDEAARTKDAMAFVLRASRAASQLLGKATSSPTTSNCLSRRRCPMSTSRF